MRARAAIICLLIAAPAAAQTPDPENSASLLTLSIDPPRSIDTGADLTFAATTALANLEIRGFARLKSNRRIGIPVRIAKTVLLDHPVALFMVVMQHEQYGHGGRAREFGAGARYQMGSPWTIDALFKGSTRFGGGATWDAAKLSVDDLLRVYTGGVESNTRSATIIERELVAGRQMTTLQLLYFVRSRMYPSYYVLVNTPNPVTQPAEFYAESRGGDVATYLGYLNTKYFGSTGVTPSGSSDSVVREYRRLRRHAWLSVAEPGIWLSLWSVGRQTFTGDEPASLTLPRLAGHRVLPIVTADWFPDGGAISVETVFSRTRDRVDGPRWFSLLVRQGNGPGGRFWHAGGATEMFAAWRGVRMGGELEVWKQPSSGAGAGAKIRATTTRGRVKGLFVDAGVKTAGHWPGRPANAGLFFRVGYTFIGAH